MDDMMRPSLALAPLALVLALAMLPASARAQHEHRPGMQHPGDSAGGATKATLPGQDAFGAIAEIVAILRADSTTDWSRVNIEALRQHLIDMNLVTLGAKVTSESVAQGLRMDVTGEGRTVGAIRRMVGAHGNVLAAEGMAGVSSEIPGGVRWTVTSADPARVAELRALGFIGIMTVGDHHTTHHLQLARGETPAGHGHH
jgi:hypothetical protein